MRSTSSGSRTMYAPFSENISTIVNSSATSVSGATFGTKWWSYHSAPRARRSTNRVSNPPRNGMPR